MRRKPIRPDQRGVVTVMRRPDGTWCADRHYLGGSPVTGHGRTWKEAIGDMVVSDPNTFGLTAYVVDEHGKPIPADQLGLVRD